MADRLKIWSVKISLTDPFILPIGRIETVEGCVFNKILTDNRKGSSLMTEVRNQHCVSQTAAFAVLIQSIRCRGGVYCVNSSTRCSPLLDKGLSRCLVRGFCMCYVPQLNSNKYAIPGDVQFSDI